MNQDYREYKLDNGLVVALQSTSTHTLVTELTVNFGAVHEREDEKGLAHLLEHCLAANSSKKYGPKEYEKITGDLGYFNAQTDIGETNFLATMLPEYFEQWLDFISNQIFNPRFNAREVNKERQRILIELADRRNDSSFEAKRKFRKAFFREHPISINTGGKEEVVKTASISKLKQFHSRGYYPNNINLILVGALPENTEKLIEKHFGKQEPGKSTKIKYPRLRPLKEKTIIHTPAPYLYDEKNPKESLAELDLVFVTVPESHPDSSALSAISYFLGESGVNSRFFRILGKKGLAYHVESSYGSSYNAGSFEISAKVLAGKLEKSIDCIFKEMQKLRKKRVTKKELERCKRRAKYELAEMFDSNEGYVMAIEKRLEGWTPELCLSKFNALTLENIREVANKYLPKDRETGKYVLGIKDPLKE